jgi:hypothetical protein
VYVFMCRGEQDDAIARSVRHLDTPDIALAVRLCQDARQGRLSNHAKILSACISSQASRKTILARHLPLVHTLLRADARRAESLAWLRRHAEEPGRSKFRDQAVARFLSEEFVLATR